MLRFLKGPVLGTFSCFLWLFNTLFWTTPLFVIALFKLMFIPFPLLHKGCSAILNDLASAWVGTNTRMIKLFINIKYEIIGDINMDPNNSYLVISNHQSWADILVLGATLNRKIPFLKFFIKQTLIYVPILGLAWWALDYPFMQRRSKKALAKNPSLRLKDLDATIKACEKFKELPVSIMNFVEGSRFSEAGHREQNSPYKHLLVAKAGGAAYALQTMGKQLSNIIDVTIIYPKHAKTMWDFLCGKITHIKVYLREIPITSQLIGDYNDKQFREFFQAWLNHIWKEKDLLLGS
jgi:1-acyl-sn-glycerol-3-phosphate acyltransferase